MQIHFLNFEKTKIDMAWNSFEIKGIESSELNPGKNKQITEN
jgi:hypothetical protein